MKRGKSFIHTSSRIAVIGPEELVDKCISLQDLFPTLNLQPFYYQSDFETVNIVSQLSDDFHYILFCGPIPFSRALYLEKMKKIPNSYIPFHGSSLLKALFQAQKLGELNRISLDTIHVDLVLEAFQELEILKSPKHIVEIHPERDALFLANYHKTLYEKRETVGAITISSTCYKILQKHNIPCIKVTPLLSTVREALEKVNLTCENLHNLANQISVGIISLGISENPNLQIDFEEYISKFVNKLDGQYIKKSPTKFLFFTTRSMIENQTNSFTILPTLFHEEEGLEKVIFSIGVGIGGTTNLATESAFVALKEAKRHSQKYIENSLFVVHEGDKTTGPITTINTSKSIDLRTTDASLLEIAKISGLSTKTLNRVIQAIKQVGNEFTVNEIAPYMEVSVKNMQRICRKLENSGALKVVGKETLESKGKPRRIFTLNEDRIVSNKGRG